MITPTPSQVKIRDTDTPNLLVVAPAGCGKTEALALRVQGMLRRGDVSAPRKILVVTFSNRARDNIRERLSEYIAPAVMRERVSISNFHGLAARLFRAHANVIDLDPLLTLPESDWVAAKARSQGYDFNAAAGLQKALRIAKQEPRTDAAVMRYLTDNHHRLAMSIESKRVKEGLLTYDDLPRLAELILSNDAVSDLYRSHFGAVIVDEFQDLTPQQLRIVNYLGLSRTTFAGDLAQGIYSFAGAQPAAIYAAITSECSEVIEFSESHRSSPAVLAMVNSLNSRTGGTDLTSAEAASWPGGGVASVVHHNTTEEEAERVRNIAAAILKRAPNHRVGIISRTIGRRRFVESALSDAGLEFLRWDDAILDTDTARTIKALLSRFDVRGYEDASDKIHFLREASALESVPDPSERQNLLDALSWCHDLLRDGATPQEVKDRVRVGDATTLITAKGIHLLTGHVGKGQQFDWVIVVGLEDGVLPDFRAESPEARTEEARVLSVMISRARHGVILSHARMVPIASGAHKYREPSEFLSDVGETEPLSLAGLADWIKQADWDAVSAR